MRSSWRYRHVAITPYSIEGFHGFARRFFLCSLVLFHGLKIFSMDKPVNSLIGEKVRAHIEVNRKTNCPNFAGPTFSNPGELPTIFTMLSTAPLLKSKKKLNPKIQILKAIYYEG